MFRNPAALAPRPMARPQLPPGHPAARVGQNIPGVNQGMYPQGCGLPACDVSGKTIVGLDVGGPELTWTRIGALPAGQTGNAFTAGAAGDLFYFTFTSRCAYRPQALYLEPYVTATGAAAAVDVVGIFSCTIDGANLLGTAKDALANAGRVPGSLFSDPRQNCCPLFSIGQVPAMASLIIVVAARNVTPTTMAGAVIGEA